MVINRVDEFIKNPKKALFILAAPVVLAMVVQTMYNVVDTAFVGRLGPEAIAALTFSFPLYFILMALNAGLSVGMGSLISRSLGAKKHADAENAAVHGVFLSLILAAIVYGTGLLWLPAVMQAFGASGNVLQLSLDFMSIVLLASFVQFPASILNTIFSSEGDTKTAMTVQIITLALNIILDPILIYWAGLGVKGAAIATLISISVGLILYILLLKRSTIKLRVKEFSPSKRILSGITSVGGPAAVMMVIMSIYVIFLNGFMNHYGTYEVAAFGVVSRLESVALLPIIGLSSALMTLVAMFTGAKRHDLLKDIIDYGMKVGVGFTCVIGAILFFIPGLFISIFTPDPKLIMVAAAYLRLDVFTFPLMAIVGMVSRVMQGIGHGFPSLFIQLVRIFGIAVPLAYVFVNILHLSYLWIAGAMILGGVVASGIAILWLRAKISSKGFYKSIPKDQV